MVVGAAALLIRQCRWLSVAVAVAVAVAGGGAVQLCHLVACRAVAWHDVAWRDVAWCGVAVSRVTAPHSEACCHGSRWCVASEHVVGLKSQVGINTMA